MSTFLTSLTSLLQQVAEPAGLDVQTLIRSKHTRSLAERPGRLPTELADRILMQAAALMDDTIGLRAGEKWRPIDFGALGFAWLASYTLRSAFLRTARYSRVLGERTRFSVSESADGVKLAAESDSENRVAAAILIDIAFSTLLSMCRQHGAPDFRPLHVPQRRLQPPARPAEKCQVVIDRFLGQRVVAHRLPLAPHDVGEGFAASRLELGPGRRIHFEKDLIVDDDGEEQPIAIDAKAPEHGLRADLAERREAFAEPAHSFII